MATRSNAGSLVGQRLGKYEILALLAIGGTAEIYLARIGGEAGFQKYVVVKCLLDHLADDVDFVRMFLDEARLGAQLHHSNIVQTLELGQDEGRYYLVMEFLAGLSLAQLARKAQDCIPGGRIPTHLVLALAAQACGGLHYAHQRLAPDGSPLNIVHRDVTPQNLVVSFDGVLKIVDFGIAKAELRQTHTRSGTVKGKFAYMSPEQCRAEPVDRRTDIFALGTVLYECLTARRLFKRASTYDTYQAIVSGVVASPSRLNPGLDEEIDALVLKALARDREERFESAEALGEALLAILHRRGTSVSSGDVSRLFDMYFAPELEEHGQRMRELVSGGPVTKSTELSWNPDGDDGSAPSGAGGDRSEEEDDDGPIEPPSAEPADLDPPGSPPVTARRPRRARDEDRGDFGGDTQIELDPDEMIARAHFNPPARSEGNASARRRVPPARAEDGGQTPTPTLRPTLRPLLSPAAASRRSASTGRQEVAPPGAVASDDLPTGLTRPLSARDLEVVRGLTAASDPTTLAAPEGEPRASEPRDDMAIDAADTVDLRVGAAMSAQPDTTSEEALLPPAGGSLETVEGYPSAAPRLPLAVHSGAPAPELTDSPFATPPQVRDVPVPGAAPEREIERRRHPRPTAGRVTPPLWQLVVAFVASAGVGLGLTVLVLKLL